MMYLNLLTAIWAREEYVGCKPLDRATWHSLMFYCAVVENGGRIPGCKSWSNGKCKQALKLKRHEILRQCPLWAWDGDDLVVRFFPKSHQDNMQVFAAGASAAAKARWDRQRGVPTGMQAGMPTGMPEYNTKEYNTKECIGREGNLPAAFPPTPEEAIRLGAGYDADFVRKEWLEAAARGGCDWKMRPIFNWIIYLEVQRQFRAAKPQESQTEHAPAKESDRVPLWRRLQLHENELKEVKEKLERLPRFSPNVNPEGYQKKEEQAIPLRARRDELKRLIADLQKQQQP